VWFYDFVFDWCANGQQLKCLTITDEWTKEGLAIEVDGRIRSGRVIEVLSLPRTTSGNIDDEVRQGPGGYTSKDDIEKLHALGIELFSPLPKSKGDPAAPKRGDKAGAIAWRQRMASDQGIALYRRRFATERPHAHMRNHGLRQVLVRGKDKDKVKAVVLWHVHAFNFLQFKRLNLA
jgi:hypothetical protein